MQRKQNKLTAQLSVIETWNSSYKLFVCHICAYVTSCVFGVIDFFEILNDFSHSM